MRDPRIREWLPEDETFWTRTGRSIAYRNLWISVPALLLAFCVWMVWSVVVVKLKTIGFQFTEQQEFWLTALPALTGATLRIIYSFTVPMFGGRNWTVFSTATLLLPAIGIGVAVQRPDTPYSAFVALALLCGLGGANFASSMTNINPFFPKRLKGTALGVNAGLGNLGVSFMQFLVPVVMGVPLFGTFGGAAQVGGSAGQSLWLQNAGFVWVPMILVVTIAAFFGMNNLDVAKASFRHQAVIFRSRHNWIMCWLYLGTFGSFIGYSAAFPKLIKAMFVDVDPLRYAFLGPLVGALARPVGGYLADRFGGARITFWNFLAMILAVLGVLYFLEAGSFSGFFVMFLVLFVTTGVGNASTFKMIPAIFLGTALERFAGTPNSDEAARLAATREGGAVLGFSSALGAYGGFIIPIVFGAAIKSGAPEHALHQFLGFYVTCVLLTWWFYSRKGAEAPC